MEHGNKRKKGWIYTKYNHEGRIKDLKNQKNVESCKKYNNNNKKNGEKKFDIRLDNLYFWFH